MSIFSLGELSTNTGDLQSALTVQILGRAIDSLEMSVIRWSCVNGSGIPAVIDRIKGSPDLPLLKKEADGIASAVRAAKIDDSQKGLLLARLEKVRATIAPGDIKVVTGSLLVYVAYRVFASLLGEGAAAVAGRMKKRNR